MRCQNCQQENIRQAQYCAACGTAFSDEQREAAYADTVYGKIEKLESIKSWLTLEAITSHPVFRVLLIVAILAVGLLLGRPHGNRMTILESDAYTVSQHRESGDYYLLTDKAEVGVSLYLPKKAETLTLKKTDGEQVLSETTFTAEEGVALQADDTACYRIEANYGGKTESITVYVPEQQ